MLLNLQYCDLHLTIFALFILAVTLLPSATSYQKNLPLKHSMLLCHLIPNYFFHIRLKSLAKQASSSCLDFSFLYLCPFKSRNRVINLFNSASFTNEKTPNPRMSQPRLNHRTNLEGASQQSPVAT